MLFSYVCSGKHFSPAAEALFSECWSFNSSHPIRIYSKELNAFKVSENSLTSFVYSCSLFYVELNWATVYTKTDFELL